MDIGNWTILDTGAASPERNMALDVELLENQALAQSEAAILHFYEWSAPSATYGYFINPDDFLLPEGIAKTSLQIARRPTGGGIIFHITDFAFSMIVPASHCGYAVNILDNYAFVNTIVMDVVKKFSGSCLSISLLPLDPVPVDESSRHFCMAKPTKYDVMVGGRKVGGGAQRRTRHAFLHQGTISLALPDRAFLDTVLRPGTCVYDAMKANTYTLMPNGEGSPCTIAEARNQLKSSFREVLFL